MICETGVQTALRIHRRILFNRDLSHFGRRALHDGRNRLSEFWTPTGGKSDKHEFRVVDSTYLLNRAGFIRAAYSGVFQILPLGLRVQEKIERLIDKHMRRLGASKVSLSSFSSQELWRKSGRLKNSSEIFKFRDRRGQNFLLAPTHEEEITAIAGSLVTSYKELPLRLYQISRKYRDERRPREGLLRGREFIMKDLYTFDYDTASALETYEAVQEAYFAFFDELKIPYLVAVADSGNMGGSLSHEFHIASSKGEDIVVKCSYCDYVANEELAESGISMEPPIPQVGGTSISRPPVASVGTWTGLTKDGNTLVNVFYPRRSATDDSKSPNMSLPEINLHVLKNLVPDIDVAKQSGVQNAWQAYKSLDSEPMEGLQVLNIFDHRVPKSFKDGLPKWDLQVTSTDLDTDPSDGKPLNLQRIESGDPCPRCADGSLSTVTAIELGHTFFLGTRYSSVLNANVAIDPQILDQAQQASGSEEANRKTNAAGKSHLPTPKGQVVPMQMGCHGIGVSRMIAAVADNLADSKGLNWPRAIAPFEAVIVTAHGLEATGIEVYDSLKATSDTVVDAILDDREKDAAWKLKDADMIGYPVIIMIGSGWKARGRVEVQCRRLQVKDENVDLKDLPGYVESLLRRL